MPTHASELPGLAVASIKAKESLREYYRSVGSLWYLATEKLGYDRLSVDFHKPMMDEMDRRDLSRPLVRVERAKLYEKTGDPRYKDLRPKGARDYLKNELDLWARDHYKTTVFIARCIRLALLWPDVAISGWHAVEDKIQETADEMGRKFLDCDALRALWPEIMPPRTGKGVSKRWLTAEGFTLRRTQYRKHPTFYAKGAGSEVTGGHCDVGWMDNPIGLQDVEDNQMDAKRRWHGKTVTHVVRTDFGWQWCTATRWDEFDLYRKFIESKYWDHRRRGACETDGVPDKKGAPVLYDLRWIQQKMDDPDCDVDAQLFNDPTPIGSRLWVPAKCEHVITAKEAAGPGTIVILHDPTPANLGATVEDKKRADGQKDDWAVAVVKLRRKGDRREIILLDGQFSKEWDLDTGFRLGAILQRKWAPFGRPHVQAVEHTGQAIATYHESHRRIARQEGVKHRPVDLTMTMRGKNVQFAALCSRAGADEFLICDTVPREFLDKLFEQARAWRKLPQGRNSLPFDDVANVVSFATDPAFAGENEDKTDYFVNATPYVVEDFSPFGEIADDDQTMRTRYAGW